MPFEAKLFNQTHGMDLYADESRNWAIDAAITLLNSSGPVQAKNEWQPAPSISKTSWKAGSSAAALTAGQYFYDYGSAKPKDSEIISAANVFSSSKNTWTVNTVTSLVSGDPAYYQVFTMRLDDDAHPSKYNLRVGDTAKLVTGRFPVDWKVETSVDGETWTVVSTVTDAEVPTVDFTWYENGGSDTQPTAFYEFSGTEPGPTPVKKPKINGKEADLDGLKVLKDGEYFELIDSDWKVDIDRRQIKDGQGEVFHEYVEYYTLTQNGNEYYLNLNEKALPTFVDPAEGVKPFEVTEDKVYFNIVVPYLELYYNVKAASSLSDEFEDIIPVLPPNEPGDAVKVEIVRNPDEAVKFYRFCARDVEKNSDK